MRIGKREEKKKYWTIYRNNFGEKGREIEFIHIDGPNTPNWHIFLVIHNQLWKRANHSRARIPGQRKKQTNPGLFFSLPFVVEYKKSKELN